MTRSIINWSNRCSRVSATCAPTCRQAAAPCVARRRRAATRPLAVPASSSTRGGAAQGPETRQPGLWASGSASPTHAWTPFFGCERHGATGRPCRIRHRRHVGSPANASSTSGNAEMHQGGRRQHRRAPEAARREETAARAVIGRPCWGRGVNGISNTVHPHSPISFHFPIQIGMKNSEKNPTNVGGNGERSHKISVSSSARGRRNRSEKIQRGQIPSSLCVIVFQFIRSQIETQKS